MAIQGIVGGLAAGFKYGSGISSLAGRYKFGGEGVLATGIGIGAGRQVGKAALVAGWAGYQGFKSHQKKRDEVK